MTVDFIESMWLLIPIFWIYRLLFMIIKNVFVIVFVNHNCIEQRGQTVLFVPIQPVNISARYLVYNK